jgi:hypothetical protein
MGYLVEPAAREEVAAMEILDGLWHRSLSINFNTATNVMKHRRGNGVMNVRLKFGEEQSIAAVSKAWQQLIMH